MHHDLQSIKSDSIVAEPEQCQEPAANVSREGLFIICK